MSIDLRAAQRSARRCGGGDAGHGERAARGTAQGHSPPTDRLRRSNRGGGSGDGRHLQRRADRGRPAASSRAGGSCSARLAGRDLCRRRCGGRGVLYVRIDRALGGHASRGRRRGSWWHRTGTRTTPGAAAIALKATCSGRTCFRRPRMPAGGRRGGQLPLGAYGVGPALLRRQRHMHGTAGAVHLPTLEEVIVITQVHWALPVRRCHWLHRPGWMRRAGNTCFEEAHGGGAWRVSLLATCRSTHRGRDRNTVRSRSRGDTSGTLPRRWSESGISTR